MPALARAVVRGRADPRSDPRFKRVVDKLNTDSRQLKQHPSPAKKAAEPAAAAKGPANEKAAVARTKQVDKIESSETKKPETTSFLALLQAEIAKAMPKTLGDTEKFMQGGASGDLKGSLKGNVAQQKQEATGDLKKNSGEAPSEAGVPAKPVTPIAAEPAAPAAQVNGADAMPAPKPDAEVSLQASKADVQGDLEKEKLTDDRLKKANDPRFSAVLTAKDAVNKQADARPAQYRAKEAGTLAQTAAKAVDVAKKGAAVLLGVKGGSKAKVLSRQEQQKAKEEQELKGFTDFVVSTFERTKQAVDKRLELLEAKVNEMFDRGVDAAINTMKSFVDDQLFQYKLKRYLLVPFGLALWIKDQVLGLPDEVNRFYEAGRARFTGAMNALAAQVANLVESQLAAAKGDVKAAQAQITARAATLSPGVKTRAAQVQAEFAGKFAELESSIDDKKQQLAEGLAQKYKEAFDKADEALKAIQDENKSLVDKAKEKIGEVLKALAEFKDRLMGILRKGKETLDLILKDPIQFLSNLIAAIKQGFQQFVGNIWTHLKKGFMKWLFGALAGAGIEIPSDLTLPSILKLVLGVLGITYERMRAKAVKLIGERAVSAIEKIVEYITILVKGGPAALWEKVKEDLSNLKEMVIDAIQDWLISTIIQKAVAKIVTMFNPAGAIIQAITMIVSVVQFVIERAAAIAEFVESVINSMNAIATGQIGGAASWIERSLGNLVPIVIGLLASLIGLGGISQKIKDFIKKVQAKVDQAIDKMIAKAVKWVKGLLGKLTGKKDKDKEKTEDGDVYAKAQKALVNRLGSQASPNRARNAAAEVLRELASDGLKSLELRWSESTQSYVFDASASPGKEIIWLAPSKAHVVLYARMVFEGSPKTGIEERFLKESRESLEITGGQAIARPSPPREPPGLAARDPRGLRKPSLVVVEPAPESSVLEAASWNAGGSLEGSNVSHAEAQFVHWVTGNQRGVEWRRRIREVDIHISHSPCDHCAPDLAFLATILPKAKVLRIRWDALYVDKKGKRSTSAAGIAKLSKWTLSGPMPAGAEEALKAVKTKP